MSGKLGIKLAIGFVLNRRALNWLPDDLGLCLVGCGRQVRTNVRFVDKMLNIKIISLIWF